MYRFARHLSILTAVFAAAVLCSTARATIMVPLPVVEVPASESVQNVSFDVPIVITSPDTAFDSFGYGIRFRVVPQGGATGSVTITGGSAASSNPAFSAGDISFTTQAGGLEAFVQAFNNTAQNLSTGEGLFSFDLSIAAGTLGDFVLEFFDAPGEPTSIFDDAPAIKAGVTFVEGEVAVTPEPGSMALLTAGVLLLGLRRRKHRTAA